MNNVEPKHLEKLHEFVREEIARYEAAGDLPPGRLTAEEVAEAAVSTAYRQSDRGQPSPPAVEKWLIKLATRQIEAEVRSLRTRRGKVVQEERPCEAQPSQRDSRLGDEKRDIFQWDRDMRIDGIIADFEVPVPGGLAEQRELQGYVSRALTLLPRGWRMAIMSYHVDGRPLAEIAKVNGITEDEAKRYLQYAREYFRQILLESGLKLRKSAGAGSQTKLVRKAAN